MVLRAMRHERNAAYRFRFVQSLKKEVQSDREEKLEMKILLHCLDVINSKMNQNNVITG